MTPQHPRFARAYARVVGKMNKRGATQHRRELLAGLQGNVIEIGAGEGSSFALYPDAVQEVLAVEPDDYLRGLASGKAGRARVPVRVVPGTAENIPAADGSADAVVVSLVLCSVPSQEAALAEIRRVLKPEGTLAFYEHVRSNHRFASAVEDFISPAWQRMAGGCHPNRDTLGAIVDAGFDVLDNRGVGFAVHWMAPPFDHILGHAMGPAKAS
ncbi:class I SAM-dependent methyltransferase [bacterium RCC_150]